MTFGDKQDQVESDFPLTSWAKNRYSQNGEDGIIAKLLEMFPQDLLDHWCVEFGAVDGKQFSNTFALVENGWNAIYIEGDATTYPELANLAKNWPQIIPINVWVDHQPNSKNSLDNILSGTNVTKEFDVLSIDIDSKDLEIWESLENYRPKIVIIEINSQILPGLLVRDSINSAGCSFSSAVSVGQFKGYTLVAHTGNCIFVRNDFLSNLNFPEKYRRSPEILFRFDAPWIYHNAGSASYRFKLFIGSKIPSWIKSYE
jgi:hypothetical protein